MSSQASQPPFTTASGPNSTTTCGAAPPKPKIPDMPKTQAQEQHALKLLWTANGAAMSAASGLMAFTGTGQATGPLGKPVPVVRDFWTPSPGHALATEAKAGEPPATSTACRWKRTNVWEADLEGQAKRAAQPPPKKYRWKRVVAMSGQ